MDDKEKKNLHRGRIKNYRQILMLLSFLIFLFSNVRFPRAEERLRLIDADRMESATEGGIVIRRLVGNVRWVQGEAFMECDEAVWFETEGRVRLMQNVRIYDGKRTLRADEVIYDEKSRIEQALGHAIIGSGAKTIEADQIVYWRDTEQASAKGKVAVKDTVERLLIEADAAFYDRKNDYCRAEGNPHAVKVDTSSAKNDWHIRGLKMETWGKERRAVVTDSVSIEQKNMKASARLADYFSVQNLLILRHSPRVVQTNREITGDSMFIRLKDMRFEGGRVFGKAKIVSRDSTGQDELKGSQITIEARGDTLDRVIVEGQAQSFFHAQDENRREQGVNATTGDRIEMTFKGGRLQVVDVTSSPGLCTGEYQPDGEKTGKNRVHP
jgi:lipopolysaccharide export system protein LptA